jgi:hypothetical protein
MKYNVRLRVVDILYRYLTDRTHQQ